MRFRLLVPCALLLAALGAACLPPGPSAPPDARPCTETVSVDGAIDCAFAELGLQRQDEAHRVASCESGKNPYATNGQYRGLFQLGYAYNATIAFYGGDVFDPYTNAQAARDSVKNNGGWVRWQCQP